MATGTKRTVEPIKREHTTEVHGYLRPRVKAKAWSFESGCSRDVYVDVKLDGKPIGTVRVPMRLPTRRRQS